MSTTSKESDSTDTDRERQVSHLPCGVGARRPDAVPVQEFDIESFEDPSIIEQSFYPTYLLEDREQSTDVADKGFDCLDEVIRQKIASYIAETVDTDLQTVIGSDYSSLIGSDSDSLDNWTREVRANSTDLVSHITSELEGCDSTELVSVAESIGVDESLVVSISDYGDADGRGCVAVLKNKYDDTDTDVVYLAAGHRSGAPDPLNVIDRALECVPKGTPVVFSDISPNEDEAGEYLDALRAAGERFQLRIRDHHPWPSEIVDELAETVDSFVVESRDQNPVCATQLVLREDYIDAPKHIKELAYVTAVRDLWIDDHPEFTGRGEDINDFAFSSDEYGQYAEITSQFGADIRNHEETRKHIEQVQETKEEKIQTVADGADWYRFELPTPIVVSDSVEYDYETGEYTITESFDAHELGDAIWSEQSITDLVDDARIVGGSVTVAVAYGTSYPSGTGNELINRGADVAMYLTPHGDAGFRSSEEYPIAGFLATGLSGGGHPQAAGLSPEVVLRPDEVTYLVGEEGVDPRTAEITTRTANWADVGRKFQEIMVNRLSRVLGVEIEQIPVPDSDADADSDAESD